MCGIVAIVGKSDVAERLFDGLKRLEYRGYDSAGICTVQGGEFDRRRAPGKLDNLQAELKALAPCHAFNVPEVLFQKLDDDATAALEARFSGAVKAA